VRVVLFFVSVWAISTWPLITMLVLWGAVLWIVPWTGRLHRELTRLRARDRTGQDGSELLRVDLEQARREIKRLIRELEAALAKQPQASSSEHSIYRRVGLDPGCPKWVAEAVRKAYRTRLHPDAHPPHRKRQAEQRFQETESVFHEIWASRGF
jgi:hypothetical protein